MGCPETLLAVSREIQLILKLKQLQLSTVSRLKENQHSLKETNGGSQGKTNNSLYRKSFKKILDDIEDSIDIERQ